MKSVIQRIVALSVSEAELFSATQCTQDILCVCRLLNNIAFKLKLPILIEVDNQVAVDLAKTGLLEEEHNMSRYISIF